MASKATAPVNYRPAQVPADRPLSPRLPPRTVTGHLAPHRPSPTLSNISRTPDPLQDWEASGTRTRNRRDPQAGLLAQRPSRPAERQQPGHGCARPPPPVSFLPGARGRPRLPHTARGRTPATATQQSPTHPSLLSRAPASGSAPPRKRPGLRPPARLGHTVPPSGPDRVSLRLVAAVTRMRVCARPQQTRAASGARPRCSAVRAHGHIQVFSQVRI